MQSPEPDFAERLAGEGFGAAGDLRDLLPTVYADLKRIAHRQLFRNVRGATLSTTVLVHETYARIAQGRTAPALDRTHFIALCARVMRQVIIDHLRARGAGKRGGGGVNMELLDRDVAEEAGGNALLAMAEALDTLAAADVRLARLIELHWFIGLEPEELAVIQGVNLRTIQRELKRARAWLGELLAS
jgi:RNA polymerase sigma factor (TIGR02999 family)